MSGLLIKWRSERKEGETRHDFYARNRTGRQALPPIVMKDFRLPLPDDTYEEWIASAPAFSCDAIIINGELVTDLDLKSDKFSDPDLLSAWSVKSNQIITSIPRNMCVSAIQCKVIE